MSLEDRNSTPEARDANFDGRNRFHLSTSLSLSPSCELELSPSYRLDARLEARAATGAREDDARDCIFEEQEENDQEKKSGVKDQETSTWSEKWL